MKLATSFFFVCLVSANGSAAEFGRSVEKISKKAVKIRTKKSATNFIALVGSPRIQDEMEALRAYSLYSPSNRTCLSLTAVKRYFKARLKIKLARWKYYTYIHVCEVKKGLGFKG